MTNVPDKHYDIIGFDFDGVLLDSVRKDHNSWKYRMLRKTLAYFDILDTRQNMQRIYMEHLAKNIETFCRDFGIDEPETLWQVREKNLREEKYQGILSSEIPLFSDVRTVEALSRSHTLAICSNATQRMLDFSLDYFSLSGYFSCWVGRSGDFEDLSRMKPNPYYLNKMIAMLDSTSILYVGDREQDQEAARNAGIDSLLLSRDGKKGDIQNLDELAAYLR
jgi:phosphoglycolate phosphatase